MSFNWDAFKGAWFVIGLTIGCLILAVVIAILIAALQSYFTSIGFPVWEGILLVFGVITIMITVLVGFLEGK